MRKFSSSLWAKCLLGMILAFCCCQPAWAGIYQQGTVVRMRMVDCLPLHKGFMATFGGPAAQMATEVCPEYTLVSDKVVFVIVGRSSNEVIPLADIIDFRVHKNELAVRVDDARHESRFAIKEMVLRSEWDLVQKHLADQLNAPPRPVESGMATRSEN